MVKNYITCIFSLFLALPLLEASQNYRLLYRQDIPVFDLELGTDGRLKPLPIVLDHKQILDLRRLQEERIRLQEETKLTKSLEKITKELEELVGE